MCRTKWILPWGQPANYHIPNGCVPNGLNGLFYLNDGYSDCVNGADELNATPTSNCGDDNSTLSLVNNAQNLVVLLRR